MSDWIAARFGLRTGRCLLPALSFACTAVLLVVGSRVHSAAAGGLILACGAGVLYISQSAFWAVYGRYRRRKRRRGFRHHEHGRAGRWSLHGFAYSADCGPFWVGDVLRHRCFRRIARRRGMAGHQPAEGMARIRRRFEKVAVCRLLISSVHWIGGRRSTHASCRCRINIRHPACERTTCSMVQSTQAPCSAGQARRAGSLASTASTKFSTAG